MKPNIVIKDYSDFSSGVFERSNTFANLSNPLAADFGLKACADADNVVMTENGLEKMMGFDNHGSAISGTPIITGMFEYRKKGSGAANYHIVCAGTKVYTNSAGTLTEIYSGITAGVYFNFKVFNNVCLLMNGTDSMLQFNGSTCTTVTFNDPDGVFGTAKPKFAEVFRDRIYFTGDDTFPSKVWTPVPGSYTNFDNNDNDRPNSVDAFHVSLGDGSKITGIKALTKDILVVYKDYSIRRISGTNPFGASVDPHKIEEISNDIGCIAPRSIVQVGQDHFFLSHNGLKRLSTVVQYGDIRDQDPTYQLKDSIAGLNFTEAHIQKAFANYIPAERHIYLHVPTGSGTTNTQVYVHDPVTGCNMPRSGITASCGALVNRIYYTGNYVGQMYQQLTGDNYDAAVIPSFWESKWLPFGSLNYKKIFRTLRIFFETSGVTTITVQWSIMKMDGTVITRTKSVGTVTADTWDSGLWDEANFTTGDQNIFKKNNLGRGAAIKIRIINNKANERWKVRRIEFGIQNLGRTAA